ncbi:MAG: phosphatidylglycerol lysyltransferase domain-containing protein [Ardenticatenaceae bacterium]|nr:phosphatidylglycerol lysyltransferase domain-containing protein [Ardenticatenaceae bacterium]
MLCNRLGDAWTGARALFGSVSVRIVWLTPQRKALVMAIIVALMGLLNVSSASLFGAAPRLRLLRNLLPPEITLSSRSLTLVTGFFLIAVAWHLAARKRSAWVATSWLLAISVVTHLLKGLDVEEALVAGALLGLLWLWRDVFVVRSDPHAAQNLLFAAPYALLFFVLYALLGFWLLRHQFGGEFTVDRAFIEALNLITFQGHNLFPPLTRRAAWFLESIRLLGIVALAYVTFNLFRPVLVPEERRPEGETLARLIFDRFGTSSIAYFSLAPDKAYFFSDSETYIAYHLESGVALAAGDPVGPEARLGSAIAAFSEMCHRNDWVPAFYQVQARHEGLYRAAGFDLMKIGEEALLDLRSWDIKGKARQDLRSALNRGEREGWEFRLYPLVDEREVVAQLEAINERWLAGKVGGEMAFTMGSSLVGDGLTRTAVAFDSQGRVTAFMTWVPMPAVSGWAADLMRRHVDAPNGTMEYLITKTALHLKEGGAHWLSLGLAPVARAPHAGDGPLSADRVLNTLAEGFNQVYHSRSLAAFKEKFGPIWEDRCLAYPGAVALPRVLYALLRVQMPHLDLREGVKALRGLGFSPISRVHTPRRSW